MATTSIPQRKPRYRRRPIYGFSLTERDLEIIRLVWLHRFLTSEHIAALVSGSPKGVLRRLQLLLFF